MGRQVFTAGEILTAANMNDLSDQTVMVFDDATARATAIPTPVEGMVTYLKDDDSLQVFDGSAFGPVAAGFTASTTITATDSSFAVPALGSPIVKVTVIGGGGGGGGDGDGGDGGTTTFDAGAAGTVSAVGGLGGQSPFGSQSGRAANPGFASGNGGGAGNLDAGSPNRNEGVSGRGAAISVAYLDLTGISTVDVTIGAGGAGGAANPAGADGGRGEVILEFVAA